MSLSLSASGLNYDLYKFRLISGVYQLIKVESIGGAFNGDVGFKFGGGFFFVISASGLLRLSTGGPLQPRPTGTSQCSVTVTTTTRIIGVASVPVTVTAQCGAGTATAARAPAAGRPGGHCQCTTVLNQGDQGGSLMMPPSLILIPDMIGT